MRLYEEVECANIVVNMAVCHRYRRFGKVGGSVQNYILDKRMLFTVKRKQLGHS